MLQPTRRPTARAGPSRRRPLGDRGVVQTAKNEVGLDNYQVRRYDAWDAHITLVLAAAAFLTPAAPCRKGRQYRSGHAHPPQQQRRPPTLRQACPHRTNSGLRPVHGPTTQQPRRRPTRPQHLIHEPGMAADSASTLRTHARVSPTRQFPLRFPGPGGLQCPGPPGPTDGSPSGPTRPDPPARATTRRWPPPTNSRGLTVKASGRSTASPGRGEGVTPPAGRPDDRRSGGHLGVVSIADRLADLLTVGINWDRRAGKPGRRAPIRGVRHAGPTTTQPLSFTRPSLDNPPPPTGPAALGAARFQARARTRDPFVRRIPLLRR
jgi:hypothetical protein